MKSRSVKRSGHNDRPPSTGIVAPVTASVAASASHAIVAATSCGRIKRAIGCWDENASADSRPYSRALSSRIGVAVEPGLTALAVTPVPRSSARERADETRDAGLRGAVGGEQREPARRRRRGDRDEPAGARLGPAQQ